MERYPRLRDLREDADLTQAQVGQALHLTQQADLFLYANTTRTARPKDNDRSGSDAHSGSGGSSFGGGGGKF